jgi:Probable transposase/Putative transposase DNA-binding domain
VAPSAAAQQRLARAKRGSKNRQRRRETVAARHRKIGNQRREFHHKQARAVLGRYEVLVVEDLQIANMMRRAKPVADVENPGRFLPNGARAKSGLNGSIGDAGWVGFVSILRAKAEDAGRVWIEVYPRHTSDGREKCGYAAAENRVTRAEFECQRCSHRAPRPTNMPHATSYGPGWPFTLKQHEKKPAAFQPPEKSLPLPHTHTQLSSRSPLGASRFQVLGSIGILGPPPNSSPESVVNPAAWALFFDTVPANPRVPAPRSEATDDVTGSPPQAGGTPTPGGAPQSGSTSTSMSANSSPYPRCFARRRRCARACSRAAVAPAAAVPGCGAFLLALEPALVLSLEPTPMTGGPTA